MTHPLATYRVTRHVTRKECPWLSKPILKGTIVHEFRGCDYGCIDWMNGIGVTAEPGQSSPVFELPRTALEVTA